MMVKETRIPVTQIRIREPDDFHVHLRDGEMMKLVLPGTAETFARALVMPNLDPPVACTADALAYRDRILSCLPANSPFRPLMTLYLTDTTDPHDVERAIADGIISAVKLYPAGATTNSSFGITDYAGLADVLQVLADTGVPLCIHGEDPNPDLDIFDREAAFLAGPLDMIRQSSPDLRIVLEHITTRDSVNHVLNHCTNTAATITVHHLVINRNDLLAGGIRPHFLLPSGCQGGKATGRRCWKLLLSGNSCFFLGTDSAPHSRNRKESACGCAGIYTSSVAMPILARIFDDHGKLDRLEAFTSWHGADFYNLNRNSGQLVLSKVEPYTQEYAISNGDIEVIVFDTGCKPTWKSERSHGE